MREAALAIDSMHLASERRTLMLCFWMFVITPTWYTAQDAILFVDGVLPLERVLVRAFPIGAPLLGLVLVRQVAQRRRDYQRFAFAMGLAIGATIFLSNLWRPDSETIPLRGRIMASALMYLLMPNTLALQIAPPLLLSSGLVLLRLARVTDLGVVAFAADAVIVAVLNVAGILMVRRRLELESAVRGLWDKEHESRLAATRADAALDTLRGIIPICSYCRKVRSEVGDWQQVEQYVRAHSTADFSHGICPECRGRHFPEFHSPGSTT